MARAHETPALSTLMRTRTIGSVEAGAEDVEGAPAAGKRPLTPADEEPPFPSSVSSFSLVRSRSSCARSSSISVFALASCCVSDLRARPPANPSESEREGFAGTIEAGTTSMLLRLEVRVIFVRRTGTSLLRRRHLRGFFGGEYLTASSPSGTSTMTAEVAATNSGRCHR